MANAQTLTFKHDGNVIPNGGELVVSTYSEALMEYGILQLTPHIKLNGTESAASDNVVTVKVEHLEGVTAELCAFGDCRAVPEKGFVSKTTNNFSANTDVDIDLHSAWSYDPIATSKCKVSAWYGDDESKAISLFSI